MSLHPNRETPVSHTERAARTPRRGAGRGAGTRNHVCLAMTSVSVSDLINDLPFGRFHVVHVGRQVILNGIFAVSIECSPYVYPGLSAEFELDVENEIWFTTCFTLGGIVGAFVSSFQDLFGRRPVIRFGAGISAVLTFLTYIAQSFVGMCILRFFLGISFFSMQYGFSAWFSEMLPTKNRGPLYVALTAGYPVGRLAAILISENLPMYNDRGDLTGFWRDYSLINGSLLACVWLITLCIDESPRYLGLRGGEGEQQARRQLQDIYTFNRSLMPEGSGPTSVPPGASTEATPLVDKSAAAAAPPVATDDESKADGEAKADDPPAAAPSAVSRVLDRWSKFVQSPPKHIFFALGLFGAVSMQQSLITNFGPRVFQRLIYPTEDDDGSAGLPYDTLMIFNASDWACVRPVFDPSTFGLLPLDCASASASPIASAYQTPLRPGSNIWFRFRRLIHPHSLAQWHSLFLPDR